jgi:hypothetical protein
MSKRGLFAPEVRRAAGLDKFGQRGKRIAQDYAIDPVKLLVVVFVGERAEFFL